MKPIAECTDTLTWVAPTGWKKDCDLRDGDDLVATLRWQSAFQAAAIGETADGIWHFQLEGFFLRQWVRLKPKHNEKEHAVFQALPSFNGILEYGDGRAFYWDSNFWLTKWIWSNEQGDEVIRAQRNLSLKAEGHMEIDSMFRGRTEISALALLGWYLIMIVSDLRPG